MSAARVTGRVASGGGVRSGGVGPPRPARSPQGCESDERVTQHERTPPPDDGTRPSRAPYMRDESGLGRALAVEREEQATEREAFRRGDRAWYVERGPTVPSPDVGAAAPILEEVEVEKGLAPVVEHPGRLQHDAGPSEDLREHGGEIGRASCRERV